MNKVRQIQNDEKNMLKVLHEFCINHHIVYYALGGTLLGAIRHEGFIPWDDDMDLGIPREHFQNFIDLWNNDFSETFPIIKHPSNLGNVSIIYKEKKYYFGGVECQPFIDIFPLDGFPDKKLKKIIFLSQIYFLRFLSKLSTINQLISRDRGLFENTIVMISKVLRTNKFIQTEKTNNKLSKLIQKYPFSSSKFGGNILGSYREKEIVPITYFSKPLLTKFEDIQIFIPSNYEGYLENIYGDFRKLPDENSRIGHFQGTYGE